MSASIEHSFKELSQLECGWYRGICGKQITKEALHCMKGIWAVFNQIGSIYVYPTYEGGVEMVLRFYINKDLKEHEQKLEITMTILSDGSLEI
jgi:hypothetical protein